MLVVRCSFVQAQGLQIMMVPVLEPGDYRLMIGILCIEQKPKPVAKRRCLPYPETIKHGSNGCAVPFVPVVLWFLFARLWIGIAWVQR